MKLGTFFMSLCLIFLTGFMACAFKFSTLEKVPKHVEHVTRQYLTDTGEPMGAKVTFKRIGYKIKFSWKTTN